MEESKKVTFTGYLGSDFQLKLLWQLVTEEDFCDKILPLLEVDYFDHPEYKRYYLILDRYYQEYKKPPSILNGSVELAIAKFSNNKNETEAELLNAVNERISNWNERVLNKDIPFNGDIIQSETFNFIKQQEYRKLADYIKYSVQKGENSENTLTSIEERVKKIVDIGDEEDMGISVLDDIQSALTIEFRSPIPTGIDGIDAVTDGGLGKGEFGMVIAPLGVGKTSLLTKIANTAYNNGKKVLQIIFEDTVDQVRRKHFAIWTKTKLSDMKYEDVLQKVENDVYKWHDDPQNNPGELYIARLSQESTTIMTIRRLIDRYYKKFGIKFDILVLDYLDCVSSHKRTNDTLEAELVVAKSFEAMANEYNIPCWTAIQGNRSSIDKDTVTTSHSGGNIKRAQKAHFVMSVAKTQDQKLIGQANLAILKARMVQDGHVFKDSIFNNDTLEIRVTDDISEYKNRIESSRNETMKDHDYKELTESFLKANNHENEYTYQDEEDDKEKIVSKKEYKYEPNFSENIKKSDILDYEESDSIQKSFDSENYTNDDINFDELEKKYSG